MQVKGEKAKSECSESSSEELSFMSTGSVEVLKQKLRGKLDTLIQERQGNAGCKKQKLTRRERRARSKQRKRERKYLLLDEQSKEQVVEKEQEQEV